MAITVRRAENADIPRILDLLLQVNNVHAQGRPDIFIPDRRKYSAEELRLILADDTRPVFAGIDEEGTLRGYCFCVLTEVRGNHNLRDRRSLYIDDLCVDEASRGSGVGRAIYSYVKDYAHAAGCYHLTLNVWACNPSALAFYKKMGMEELKREMEVIL